MVTKPPARLATGAPSHAICKHYLVLQLQLWVTPHRRVRGRVDPGSGEEARADTRSTV
jgi:hypothetical protein